MALNSDAAFVHEAHQYMSTIQFRSYNELVPYADALEIQYDLQRERQAGSIPDTVLLLEHPPTITLGRRTNVSDLLTSSEELQRLGIGLVEIDRGGEITAHGPGQLVAYPILDLKLHGQDLHKYLRDLEHVLIDTLAALNIEAGIKDGLTGVWVGDKKIAAIGIKVSRWVSMHGIALNINNDLSTFRRDFVPCGIRQFDITSIAEILPEKNLSRQNIEPLFIDAFSSIFNAV
jgi:lipoate-protein ligase B